MWLYLKISIPLLFIFFNYGTALRPKFDLENLSIEQVLENIRNGLSCQEIIRFFLHRIDKFDKSGPKLNAVIMKNPAALLQAKQLDDYYRNNNKLKGLLHCVPVLVKDIIPVKGLPTTFGLKYFLPSISQQDAPTVKLLIQQGAIVIASANLKIFAASGFVDASETGGLERNPFAPAYTVYGSSSGNAAGQAARYAVLGLGTDSAGSILGPASAVNLLGFRPTVDMYSSEGVMPLNPYSDTIAPLTFNVDDLGTILDIFTKQSTPFYRNISSGSVHKSTRIGIITEFIFGNFSFNTGSTGTLTSQYSLDDEVTRVTENAVFYFWKAGYKFYNASKDVPERIQSALNGFTHFYDCIPHYVDEFLAKRPLMSTDGPIRSFRDIYKSGRLPPQYQQLYEQISQTAYRCRYGNHTYLHARCQLRLFFDNFFEKADILIFPSSQSVPWRNNETEWSLAHFLFLPSFLDYPAISLPIGFSDPRPDAPQGLPLSLILFCKPDNLKKMLEVARDFEKSYGRQVMPYYMESESRLARSFGHAKLVSGYPAVGYELRGFRKFPVCMLCVLLIVFST